MADQLLRKLSLETKPSGRKLLERFHGVLKYRRPPRGIYLENAPPKKSNLFLGILFLLVILTFSFWGLGKAGRERGLSEYESVLLQAQRSLDESVKIVDLNPARAKELALSAKSIAEELAGRGIKDKRLRELQESLSLNLPRLLGEYKMEPQVLVDLGLVKEGFNASATSVAQDKIVALDLEKHVVLAFDFTGGGMQVIAGQDTIPEAKLVAADAHAAFVLDGQRIARIPFEKEQVTRSLVLPEGSWGRVVSLGSYGASLYLVDDVKNQIWKYSGTTERVGEGEAWLKPASEPVSVDGIVSMAIDGNIWLLTREGEILRFVQGKEVAFRVKGLEKEFANPTVLFTNGGSANIYVLDSGNSRVVVIDKEGNYKAQYLWDKLGQASSIGVWEEEKKILIFLGGKVYETELKM